MSWAGSRKCRTSSAGCSAAEEDAAFSEAGGRESNDEYDGGSSPSGDGRAAVAGRGDGGGEYAGRSRRPCGNGDGAVETWQKGPNGMVSGTPSSVPVEQCVTVGREA